MHTRRRCDAAPLCAARLSGIGPGDFVKVELRRLRSRRATDDEHATEGRLSPASKVLDLTGRLRYRGCGQKGQAVVSTRWAQGAR